MGRRKNTLHRAVSLRQHSSCISTARCYAERGIATASRLSVRPSVT